ncbi:MAG: hypothetical protein R2770_01725 [Acidimicrobiales bacterium]
MFTQTETIEDLTERVTDAAGEIAPTTSRLAGRLWNEHRALTVAALAATTGLLGYLLMRHRDDASRSGS